MATPIENLNDTFSDCPPGIGLEMLDLDAIPAHVAIIMDGNGRWASERGLDRSEGHRAGIKGVREAITACHDVGVRYLTIYSFSTENWNRPKDEVSGLMDLFASTMLEELSPLMDKQVRIRVLGDLSVLPVHTAQVFRDACEVTQDEPGMTLAIAVNYGGRKELVDAARSMAEDVAAGRLSPGDIDERLFHDHLYAPDIPDPDLLIRTSGEMRISNFLLWQIAYSEFYVTEKRWPDFDRYEVLRALLDYQGRVRRYGGV